QKQKELYSVLIPLRLGFISSERAIKLARFIKVFGDDVVRLTKNQNILLRNIPLNNLGNIYNFLRFAFEGIDEPAIYGEILSCTGAATCQLGICLSRQAAKALMRQLKASGLDLDRLGPVRFNISGCTNSCGQHPVADIGFSGKALRKADKLYPAYNVLAGAVIRDGETTLAAQVGEISAKDFPKLVIELFKKYMSGKDKFKTFREYILRQGKEDLKGLCAGLKDIPSFEEDKNYYFDWDSEVPFSLAGRGAGECSAGLFDLLEMDLANIKKAESNLASPDLSSKEKEELLTKLVFYAARMLLITRGVEPKSEDDTYAAFAKHFLETGLIDRSYRDIIALAEKRDHKALLEKETAVRSLAVSVRELYEAMDNSFNFKTAGAPAGEGAKASAPKSATVKDLRGVACPLNFVQTKVELSKLKEGDILEVWLDEGPPIENVPGSVKAEGHKIIEQKKSGSHWSVRIEKKKT
ncbi:MAG: sulfurtransferase TusA family protein, partial [Candidatus Omnitrophota bacterium]|nr:sulfurtransferase TusA family protein [Candidatus Omnitrophota bacterium]